VNKIDGNLTKEDVRKAAGRAGCDLTDDQFQRWQLAGVLRAIPKGLGRARGSEVFYPKGSDQQAALICRLLREGWGLDDCLLFLWWTNHQIDEDKLRLLLIKTIEQWREALACLVDLRTGSLTRRGRLLAKNMGNARFTGSPFGAVRRQIGSIDFVALFKITLHLQLGRVSRYAYEINRAEAIVWEALRLDLIPENHPIREIFSRDWLPLLASHVRTVDFELLARDSDFGDLRKVRDILREALRKALNNASASDDSAAPDRPEAARQKTRRGPTLRVLRLASVQFLLLFTHLWVFHTNGMTPEQKARFGAIP
jgi:hypothetical protein